MTTDSGGPHDRGDAELIASVRAGRIEEYGVLYERHVASATRLARQLCRSSADADDVVAESFAKVLDAIRDGKGPDHAFRPYLLTTVRHTAYGRAKAANRVRPTDDIPTVADTTTTFTDPAVEELERSLVTRAFHRLPERWQAVLWHTVIEQQPPAEVAPLLGMSANAVSALAYRARAGLRQEYLQAHLSETSAPRCRATATKLGAWTRDGLSLRERAQVEHHLDRCARCRALADELADVNGALRGVVAFLVLGSAALGYLSAETAPTAAAATTTTAGPGDSPGSVEAGPRQFLGVAVSGVALATAVAVALAAGGVTGGPMASYQPQANESPQAPSTSAPSETAPTTETPAPEPSHPTLPVPQPRPDSYRPLVPPTLLPPPPLTLDPPSSPTPPPDDDEPGTPPDDREPDQGAVPPRPQRPASQPTVSASSDKGVTLDAGGAPADLDVTVRNDGDVVAAAPAVELTLPEGVSAIAQPEAGGATDPEPDDTGVPDDVEDASSTEADDTPSAESPEATPRASDDTAEDTDSESTEPSVAAPVPCPAGEQSVSCEVPDELAPGQREVLRFRLQASPEARSGTLAGVVSAAGARPTPFSVPVTVRLDVLDLDVRAIGRHLHVTVRSEGVRSADASVVVDAPAWAVHAHRWTCDRDEQSLQCASRSALDPGDSARLGAHVPLGHRADTVTVTATLGEDTVSETVDLPSLLPGFLGHDEADPTDETDGTAEPTPTPVMPTTTAPDEPIVSPPTSTTPDVADVAHARSPIRSFLHERRSRRPGLHVRRGRSA
ncbi:sigma-70 family RNA polymerase sigma factor [Saccharomonospora sp. NB11]|uniref:sigma-70 family RNA polymerase sigma factor n=1 Tax=Saccharomonospora sp. NB11 TaxID=1642298 RepID=UPI0018D1DCF1|nr:sigma-70 family RNA polymerase sigma factor [Saccharomonospora sp. NB11]